MLARIPVFQFSGKLKRIVNLAFSLAFWILANKSADMIGQIGPPMFNESEKGKRSIIAARIKYGFYEMDKGIVGKNKRNVPQKKWVTSNTVTH